MRIRAIDKVMGTEEASDRWGLSQYHIKRPCWDEKVIAKRIGKT
ncbi:MULTISPECIES: helix-turn-helix domain-containing protein [Paenibacillus]|nr:MULTISPECIES: helix-turn-helix domain-containing protein [Paenibacillus]